MPRFSALKTSVIRCLAAAALCLVFADAAVQGCARIAGLRRQFERRLRNAPEPGLGKFTRATPQRSRTGPWRVVNASISGDTTSGALKRLPTLLELHAPKVVIIELGGNDGLQGKPLDTIESNLRQP